MAHQHPCQQCGALVDCAGPLEENPDGVPAVICRDFHLAGGHVNPRVVCDACQRPRRVTRPQLVRRAAALNVTLDFRPDSLGALHEIVLTAPPRQVFAGTGLHENVIASQVAGAPMASLYAAVLDDMVLGVEPCVADDCEWCA